MGKILKVNTPFFVMENGDTFELSNDGKEYISSFNVERCESDDKNCTISSRYHSTYAISPEYAKQLIKDGYLSEVEQQKPNHVNIFDEITSMLGAYKEDLDTLDEDMADAPACIKIEKQTVLQNLITTLEYLNSLKKQ